MASYTPNVNLKKPADGDAYDIADANGNMDAIDTAIGSLRESVYPKGSFYVVVTFSTVKSGNNYHAIWPLPLGNDYTSVQQAVVSQVGSSTSPISTSDVTVRILSANSVDLYTAEAAAAGKSFLITLTLR